MAEPKTLGTIDEVIDHLGGNAALAVRYGLKTPQAVWAWRDRGEIPPKYYLAMTAELVALGCEAPASLWGMVEEAAHDAAA